MLEALIKNARKIGLAALASAFLFTSDANAQTKIVDYKSKNTPGLAQGVKTDKTTETKKETPKPYVIQPITLEAHDKSGNKVAECPKIKPNSTCEVPEGSTIKLTEPLYATKEGSPKILIDFTFKQNGETVINPNYDSNDKTRSQEAILSPFNLETLKMKGEYKALALAEVGPNPEDVKAGYPFNLRTYDPETRTASTSNSEVTTKISPESIKKAMEEKNSKDKNSNKKNKNSKNKTDGDSATQTEQSYFTGQAHLGLTSQDGKWIILGDPAQAGDGFKAGLRLTSNNFFLNGYIGGTEYIVNNPDTGRALPNITEKTGLILVEFSPVKPIVISGKYSNKSSSDKDSSESSSLISGGVGARLNFGDKENPGFASATYGLVRVKGNQLEGNRLYSDFLTGKEISGRIAKTFGKSTIYGSISQVRANSDLKKTKSTTVEGDFSYKLWDKKGIELHVGVRNQHYRAEPLSTVTLTTTEFDNFSVTAGAAYRFGRK